MVPCIQRCIACMNEFSSLWKYMCDILIFMCQIRLLEMERMQHVAQNNARRIIEETEKLKCDLESKSMELDKWC